MDLIERVESYKVLFKECKALEPVSMALAKGYKSATPLQRLEIIRELDTELAEVYSVEIPVITAWVRDDNYVHSTKEIFLGEPSLEGFLHQFRHHLQNKAREPQYKYLLVENDPKADYRIPYKDCMYRMYGEDDARAWARMVIELALECSTDPEDIEADNLMDAIWESKMELKELGYAGWEDL